MNQEELRALFGRIRTPSELALVVDSLVGWGGALYGEPGSPGTPRYRGGTMETGEKRVRTVRADGTTDTFSVEPRGMMWGEVQEGWRGATCDARGLVLLTGPTPEAVARGLAELRSSSPVVEVQVLPPG